ncbi:MAG: hypothetical protein ABI592_08550 [Acidobacteriota bacterium]
MTGRTSSSRRGERLRVAALVCALAGAVGVPLGCQSESDDVTGPGLESKSTQDAAAAATPLPRMSIVKPQRAPRTPGVAATPTSPVGGPPKTNTPPPTSTPPSTGGTPTPTPPVPNPPTATPPDIPTIPVPTSTPPPTAPPPPTSTPGSGQTVAIALRAVNWQWDWVQGPNTTGKDPAYPGQNGITLKAGQRYQLKVTNNTFDDGTSGNAVHYFSGISSLGISGAALSIGGSGITQTFTAAVGDYEFACTESGCGSGHDRMHGVIHVIP